MITISDAAKNRLLQLLKKDDKNSSFVRVGVESGGCSGLSYKLDFDDKKNVDDEIVENNGITLIVNKKSFLYLVGGLAFSNVPCAVEKLAYSLRRHQDLFISGAK